MTTRSPHSSTTDPPENNPSHSTRNVAIIVGSIVAALVLVAILLVVWDLSRAHQRVINCSDGQRYTIDERQFASQYSAYSISLDAQISGKSSVTLRLDPIEMRQLSEAEQSANEFRKYVVSGYNGCAITRDQYAKYGSRLQALDGLARQINGLLADTSRSSDEDASLSSLISRYSDLAQKLAND